MGILLISRAELRRRANLDDSALNLRLAEYGYEREHLIPWSVAAEILGCDPDEMPSKKAKQPSAPAEKAALRIRDGQRLQALMASLRRRYDEHAADLIRQIAELRSEVLRLRRLLAEERERCGSRASSP